MIIWLDEHLAPSIATFIYEIFKLEYRHINEIVGRESSDLEIFVAARKANAVIISKDSDFADLFYKLGAPPKIIYLTCGNISNKNLKLLLSEKLLSAIAEVLNNDFTTLE